MSFPYKARVSEKLGNDFKFPEKANAQLFGITSESVWEPGGDFWTIEPTAIVVMEGKGTPIIVLLDRVYMSPEDQ